MWFLIDSNLWLLAKENTNPMGKKFPLKHVLMIHRECNNQLLAHIVYEHNVKEKKKTTINKSERNDQKN